MARLLIVVAALMPAAGFLLSAPAFADGALAPAKVVAVRKAADELTKMGAASRQTGQPPREADAQVKTLLDTVFDIRLVSAAEPLPFSEIDRLNDWNKAVIDVGLVYILSGSRAADLTQAASDPTFPKQVEKNTVAFAPEMGRYMDAQLGMSQAMLALIDAHLAAHPADREKSNFKKGLPQVYDGSAQTLASAISTLPTAGLSDAWRKQRLTAMQSLGPHVAKIVDADDAKALYDMSLQAGQGSSDAELQAGLKKLADTFKR
jgi:hypothetical protein